MNNLCIINGDYQDFKDLNDILKSYSLKFQIKLHYSNDGTELIQNYHELHEATTQRPDEPQQHDLQQNSVDSSITLKRGADNCNCSYTCFFLNDFDSQSKIFAKLEEIQTRCSNSQHRIIIYGVPILRACNLSGIELGKATDVDRPLYCNLMNNAIVCFTGFRKDNKHIVAHCIRLVHYMGGSVRKEYNKRITHLIVKSTMSTKYKTAYNIGKCHLLTEDWIFSSWNNRNTPDFNVNETDFLKNFKLKALYSLSISFYGFSQDETQHMQDVTIENGGTCTDINDPLCTHIVINDQDIKQFPPIQSKASVVKVEWFWASIQICCRASECLYEFVRPKTERFSIDQPNKRIKLSSDNLLSNELAPSQTTQSGPVGLAPAISSTCQFNSQLLVANTCDFESPIMNSRLSTDHRNISTNLSTSASLLDATTDDAMSVDSPFDSQKENYALLNSNSNSNKKLTKRSQRIHELYETEKRFVNILHTIILYFKQPIEAPDQTAGAILDQTELKEIFGNLPPIYEVHCKIKDRLEAISQRLIANDESVCVGEVYLDNVDALLKTYPPFVNFYEKTKEAIINCDRTKPRFHAFLKIAQGKPECGRQTLVELLIRPVQRLPSTLLLLDDILRETSKLHRDNELLAKAISSLKEIMTHINEDKRKTENRIEMFGIINHIENCPATLLSSHRNLLNRIDAYEMSNELLKKGAQLTLFLFSDCLEVCKPRLKIINATKSPTSRMRSPQKRYKHIALFSLSNITQVCDIIQDGGETELFGILCRFAEEKDKLFSFKIINGQNIDKKEYVKLLAQGICNVKCITEYENVICAIEAKQLQLDLNESGGSKKFDTMKRYASRINRRVSRAFSFSQDTPNKIKKTISSVFRSPFQSGYLHTSHSLHEQKSSKLSSLASLQLTPTLLETRPFQQKTIYQQITKSARNIHILNDAITKHTSKGAFLTPYRNKNRKDENLDDVDDNEDDFENRNSNENEISNKLIFKNKNDFDSLSYDSGLNSCTKAVNNQLTKIKRTFNTIHNIENNQSITSLDSIDTS